MNAIGMRRLRQAILSAVGVVVGGILVGLPLYVFPKTDAPRKSDVIMVLGPPTASRLALARSLLARGLSKNLVVSVSPKGDDSASAIDLCSGLPGVTVYCRTPSPFTTRGEARILKSLAREHGWTSATVITFTPHVTRARFIVGRCFSGRLTMVADTAPLSPSTWVYEYFYQTGAFVKAFAEVGC